MSITNLKYYYKNKLISLFFVVNKTISNTLSKSKGGGYV